MSFFINNKYAKFFSEHYRAIRDHQRLSCYRVSCHQRLCRAIFVTSSAMLRAASSCFRAWLKEVKRWLTKSKYISKSRKVLKCLPMTKVCNIMLSKYLCTPLIFYKSETDNLHQIFLPLILRLVLFMLFEDLLCFLLLFYITQYCFILLNCFSFRL